MVGQMCMHFGVHEILELQPLKGGVHAVEAAVALTYSYKDRDGQMEDNGDTENREERRMKTKMYRRHFRALCRQNE